jgi:EmrB/QacA subfamily drug resistance transporter
MTILTQAYHRQWYVLVTVGIGTFLSSLNTSITNTVLPVIQKTLHLALSQSEWIVLIYLLILTLFLLPVGRLSDLWGHRRIFLFGFGLFTCAASFCGLSTNFRSLLWGRGLLALAGSMILSVGPALLTSTFPAEQRGRVLGIQAIMTYIGLSLGPVLGGWLTEVWGWPATFWIIVPFGLLGLALGTWAVPRVVHEHRERLDLKGSFFFVIGMTAATLLLNSKAIMQYRGLVIVLLLICFVISTWAFIHVERKQQDPLLDLNLFLIRNFGFGTFGAALNYLCFFLTLFLLPFYFDHVLRWSSTVTGTYLMMTPLVMMICAPIAGALSDRTGPRLLTTSGMFFSTLSLISFGIMAEFTSAHLILIIGLLLAGLGTGTFVVPNNSAVLGAASGAKQGVASGTLAMFRYIGMMAGITVGGSLFDLLLSHFSNAGSDVTTAFLEAFSWVMWVGAVFGIVGIVCTLSMTRFTFPDQGCL